MLVTTELNTLNTPDLLVIDRDVLRDYFAGCALTGLLAGDPALTLTTATKFAYQASDAMLAQRDAKKD